VLKTARAAIESFSYVKTVRRMTDVGHLRPMVDRGRGSAAAQTQVHRAIVVPPMAGAAIGPARNPAACCRHLCAINCG
jgi:hypothetical protein